MKKILFLTLNMLAASQLFTVQAAASDQLAAAQKRLSCIEVMSELADAQLSLDHVVGQEMDGENVLVSFGYRSAYLPAQTGLTIYNDRIQYLKKASSTLGCQNS